MTGDAPPRVLATVHRRVARRRLGRETALLAAVVMALVPPFVVEVLQRSWPALSIVVALPPADAAQAERVLHVLRGAGAQTEAAPVDAARAAELWATVDAGSAAPALVQARLWPAHGVDGASLERAIHASAPAALVDRRPVPTGPASSAVLFAATVAAAALLGQWRLRRAVRQILRHEAATLLLLHRFGADAAWIDAQLAKPIMQRVWRGAAVGTLAGAAAGLAVVLALDAAAVRSWDGATAAVAGACVLAAGLVVGGLPRLAAAGLRRDLDRAARRSA